MSLRLLEDAFSVSGIGHQCLTVIVLRIVLGKLESGTCFSPFVKLFVCYLIKSSILSAD